MTTITTSLGKGGESKNGKKTNNNNNNNKNSKSILDIDDASTTSVTATTAVTAATTTTSTNSSASNTSTITTRSSQNIIMTRSTSATDTNKVTTTRTINDKADHIIKDGQARDYKTITTATSSTTTNDIMTNIQSKSNSGKYFNSTNSNATHTTGTGIGTGIASASASASTSTLNSTRTMQNDEDFNIRFVNLVRAHKCLYDKKVAEYRNRDNQEKAWSQISLETSESVVHCKERWRNLRACLSRYIKQQNSTDPQHKPYYLTEHMAFLLPFLKSTRKSMDGNNSLKSLFQHSQQQEHQEHQKQEPKSYENNNDNNGIYNNSIAIQMWMNNQQEQLPTMDRNERILHQINLIQQLVTDDEETMDAFDPATPSSFNIQNDNNNNHNKHNHLCHDRSICSPGLSDTASADSLQPFIPDVQLSELATMDNAQLNTTTTYGYHYNNNINNTAVTSTTSITTANNNSIIHSGHVRKDSYDHQTPESKRIKIECDLNEMPEITTTAIAAAAAAPAGAEARAEAGARSAIELPPTTPQTSRAITIAAIPTSLSLPLPSLPLPTTKSTATNTPHMHLYATEQADMEFFRTILPDISELTPKQKRKFKIGLLELIDDVVLRYPAESDSNVKSSSNNSCSTSSTTTSAVTAIAINNNSTATNLNLNDSEAVPHSVPESVSTPSRHQDISTTAIPMVSLPNPHNTRRNPIREYNNNINNNNINNQQQCHYNTRQQRK